MRILTDFDGVFTTQEAEAAAVGARQVELMGEALGDRALATRIFEETSEAVRKNPGAYGWISGGAIACYADEDPYVFNNAVAAAIYAEAAPAAREKLAAAGLATHEAFTTRAFDEGTARWRAANPPHLLPEALSALADLAAAGIEVVIVSNSSTERILAILKDAGLARFGAAKPRVRGGAKKFVLGAEPRGLPPDAPFGERTIRLRRPHYHQILAEERPDLVIGDVLSLDVALPAALRETEDWFADARIVLKRHTHTPAWSLAACAARGIEVVESIAALPRLLGV